MASILLFGPDNLIYSVLAHHKIDAIFRVFNTDRYDDRDVILTNLLDSYDRLIAFGKKHLNDLFTMDGMLSVSARDKILREVVSNLLAHRDFSNTYVAKLVIEKERIYTENSNRSHGYGNLNLETFEPFSKNPPISKVFRELGLADELGSGMRNTYKYTRLYSEAEPEFKEGDVFRTVIPLSEAATATVGPAFGYTGIGGDGVTPQVATQVIAERMAALMEFCAEPRSKKEMMDYLGLVNVNHFRKKYLIPLFEAGKIRMTIPDKPNSRNQKYIKV